MHLLNMIFLNFSLLSITVSRILSSFFIDFIRFEYFVKKKSSIILISNSESFKCNRFDIKII